MPSKYNEKMLRVDRMNRMEKARLDFTLRRYDKEKLSLVHEIDREKRFVVKDFAHVRRTTGFSEEGVPSANEREMELQSDSFARIGSKRSNSVKSYRSSSRSRTSLDYNISPKYLQSSSLSSESEDEVFLTEEVFYNMPPLPDMSNIEDIERYEKELIEGYKNVFKDAIISVKKSDRKNLKRFLRSRNEVTNGKILRPHTAKAKLSFEREIPLSIRPATAGNGHSYQSNCNQKRVFSYSNDKPQNERLPLRQSTSQTRTYDSQTSAGADSDFVSSSVNQLINQILEEEEVNDYENTQNIIPRNEHKKIFIPCGRPKPENGILRNRPMSASTNQTADVGSINGSRQRKVSINSTVSGFDNSIISNMWGSIGDVSVDSNGQRKPSNWRKYVAADQAPIPETKRLVSLTTVVRAALAFSKTARKRALDKLVEEQSVDTRQIIKEERIRRLQSRSNVLKSLSSQFSLEEPTKPFALTAESNS